jgi:hypothetical protein
MHCCCSLAVISLAACGSLSRVVAIFGTIYTFRLVVCGHYVFVIASANNKVDCLAVQPC